MKKARIAAAALLAAVMLTACGTAKKTGAYYNYIAVSLTHCIPLLQSDESNAYD